MKTMQALVLHDVGKIDHVRLESVKFPELKLGHAIVKLNSAALNHRDWWIVQGLYANIKTPCILGSDAAGKVYSEYGDSDPAWIGKEVIVNPSVNWGELTEHQQLEFQILGMPGDGTFAEYVSVPIANLRLKPDYLNWNEAAALPLAGLTAYRALFTRGQMTAGQTVLITGIGGGVASLAFQFAQCAGAKTIVTSSDEQKLKTALDEGAVAAVNYSLPDYAALLRKTAQRLNGIDLILDSAGGNNFDVLLQCIKPGGTIVSYGATCGKPDLLDLRKVFWKQLNLKGSTMGSPADFDQMLAFVSAHRIKPRIDSVFPLKKYKSAFQRIQSGKQLGKIVLSLCS